VKLKQRGRAPFLGRLTFVAALAISASGVAAIVALQVGDRQPQWGGSAYAALAEVEDSPIEELPARADEGANVIHRAQDGLFHATLMVNDKPLHCIVDTGASATVLSAQDGRRIGLAGPLKFSGTIRTAGGYASAARSRLDDVTVAGHDFRHVAAFVVRNAPGPCLLGQDLLGRLDAAEIHGDKLILR
jgi:clan AA aspartic protease (TIGR02281 family)